MSNSEIMIPLEKAYEPQKYEDVIYKKWEKSGLFTPKKKKGKKPFVISMPPPNATGTLHLGHATMLAIQDSMIRYHRMKQIPTLWLPGTDHASIATQNKVEKILAEEGETRHTLGRELFLKKVDEYVKNSQDIIRNQIRKMGSSCDWTRERYTLDQGLSEAVREIFVRMLNDGLIYRGHRIVNWCPRCSSTLADDEVVFKEETTKFYYIKYGPVVIATARPETKFLDKTIVAHPDDRRYKKYFGKKITVPWIEGEIEATFIADKNADPKFGTGAMTITPAHDFIDFKIAKKHTLEIIQIIDQDGNFTDVVGKRFAGKNARASREEIVKILEEKDLLQKVDENYIHNLSVCYRCGTPIEPLVSKQWFIDVNKKIIKVKGKKVSLKQQATNVVKNKEVKIIPARFNKIYYHWLKNLEDWCISRQIWFGHQIPVWYCTEEKCDHLNVQTAPPKNCASCGSKKLIQDPDTLDTWFSSGLWTFSTLGWPKKTSDLKYFHPTSVLETGYDILFFWVARMILMSTYALGEVPFKTVYLHGLVRDRHGKKMSKSSGNGIDPLDMIAKFGTDAVRLSLIMGSSPGNDLRLYEEKIEGYRNFINKIWNSARFALMNVTEKDLTKKFSKKDVQSVADKWIVSRLQRIIKEVDNDMQNYRFSDAGTKIYNFTWSDYCDWYLEMSKNGNINAPVLLYVLKTILKLLHPLVPFITENLWTHCHEKRLIMGEEWPTHDKKLLFPNEEKEIMILQSIITNIRAMRSENGIEPAKKVNIIIHAKSSTKALLQKTEIIKRMTRLENLTIQPKGEKPENCMWKYEKGIDIYLPYAGLFDVQAEIEKLKKKLEQSKKQLENITSRLSNKNFVAKAPLEVVKKEKEACKVLEDEITAWEKKISDLQHL